MTMNVKDLNYGPNRLDSLRSSTSVDRTGQAGENPDADEAAPVKPVAPVGDRLEISDKALAASKEEAELKREVEFARKAMYSIPPMSQERAEELVEQLKNGRYNAPDVLLQLSEKLAKDIAPRSPESGGNEAE